MELQAQLFERDMFAPEMEINCITKKHTLAKIMVVRIEQPKQICGIAKRIGFTGHQDSDLAIYRLKILRDDSRLLFTVPAFFVVTNGKFVEYENWKQTLLIKQSTSEE